MICCCLSMLILFWACPTTAGRAKPVLSLAEGALALCLLRTQELKQMPPSLTQHCVFTTSLVRVCNAAPRQVRIICTGCYKRCAPTERDPSLVTRVTRPRLQRGCRGGGFEIRITTPIRLCFQHTQRQPYNNSSGR